MARERQEMNLWLGIVRKWAYGKGAAGNGPMARERQEMGLWLGIVKKWTYG